MVKILANGDIVPDDDPRAQASNKNTSPASRRPPRQQQGGIPQQQGGHPAQQGGSMFDQLNQRLLLSGLPRFNVGPYAVEPIVSVGMLVAFLLLGVKGLLLGALLFFVSKWSSSQQGVTGGQEGQAGGGGGDGGGTWGGQGHRLGR